MRDLDDTIRLMDRYQIEVSFSSDSRSLRSDYRAGNDRLLEAMQRYPGRIYGYAVANPWDGQAGLDELERCLDAGMSGIKLHISHTRLDYDHPRAIPYFELAVKRGVPVDVGTKRLLYTSFVLSFLIISIILSFLLDKIWNVSSDSRKKHDQFSI